MPSRFVPKTEGSNDLITKRYHVPPEFIWGTLGRRLLPQRENLVERSNPAGAQGIGQQTNHFLRTGLDKNKLSSTIATQAGGALQAEGTQVTRQQFMMIPSL